MTGCYWVTDCAATLRDARVLWKRFTQEAAYPRCKNLWHSPLTKNKKKQRSQHSRPATKQRKTLQVFTPRKAPRKHSFKYRSSKRVLRILLHQKWHQLLGNFETIFSPQLLWVLRRCQMFIFADQELDYALQQSISVEEPCIGWQVPSGNVKCPKNRFSPEKRSFEDKIIS